jgi:hypothetical protein
MSRFIRRGTAKVYFLPTVAAYGTTGIPTSTEVTAGTDLSGRLADLSGWMLSSDKVDTPDLANRFVANIPGTQSVADSSITFYSDDAGGADAFKTAMPVDGVGYIYIAHSGRAVGKKADLFPVRVSSIGNEYSIGNDPARYTINYAITGTPAIDVTQA